MADIGRTPWRLGNRVRRNIYDADDHDIGRMDTAELAAQVVGAVNDERSPGLLDLLRIGGMPPQTEDIPWLVKDFDALYRAAEGAAVQAQLDGYDTAHVRDLLRQLERLKAAMRQIQDVKAELRTRVIR